MVMRSGRSEILCATRTPYSTASLPEQRKTHFPPSKPRSERTSCAAVSTTSLEKRIPCAPRVPVAPPEPSSAWDGRGRWRCTRPPTRGRRIASPGSPTESSSPPGRCRSRASRIPDTRGQDGSSFLPDRRATGTPYALARAKASTTLLPRGYFFNRTWTAAFLRAWPQGDPPARSVWDTCDAARGGASGRRCARSWPDRM